MSSFITTIPARGVLARRLHAVPSVCPTRPATIVMRSAKKSRRNYAPTISNRSATFQYDILKTFECGIELKGSEVKSVREGQMNLREGYARAKDGQLFLHNVHISSWSGSHSAYNHEPLRLRRLLLHKRDILKLQAEQSKQGVTLVPTKAYFSDNGYLKFEIAIARGKQLHDKRETIKRRDQDRELRRVEKITTRAY